MKNLLKGSIFVLLILSKLAFAMESQPDSPKMEVVESSPVACQGLNEGVVVPPEITGFMQGNVASGLAVKPPYPMKYSLIKNDSLSNKFIVRIFYVVPYYSEDGEVDLSDGVREIIGEWDSDDKALQGFIFEVDGSCRYR